MTTKASIKAIQRKHSKSAFILWHSTVLFMIAKKLAKRLCPIYVIFVFLDLKLQNCRFYRVFFHSVVFFRFWEFTLVIFSESVRQLFNLPFRKILSRVFLTVQMNQGLTSRLCKFSANITKPSRIVLWNSFAKLFEKHSLKYLFQIQFQ